MGLFDRLLGRRDSKVQTGAPSETSAAPKPQIKIELLLVTSGNKSGFIDLNGQVVVPPQFEGARMFSEGLAAVRTGGKWGFIDTSGRIAIEPRFRGASRFQDGIAAVWDGESWGYVDTTGASVGAERFETARPCREGLALVEKRAKWGYMDRRGNLAISPAYDVAAEFSEGLAAVYVDGKWRFIDASGRTKLSTSFDVSSTKPQFSDGLALGRLSAGSGTRLAYVDRMGKEVLGGWPLASDFSEGLAFVADSNVDPLYYFIKKDGRFAFPSRFKSAWSFSEGLAAVSSDSKWGFVNSKGEFAIEPRYGDVLDLDVSTRPAVGFLSGVAKVEIGDRRAYIDKTGRIISHDKLG